MNRLIVASVLGMCALVSVPAAAQDTPPPAPPMAQPAPGAQRGGGMAARMMGQLDTDHDGKISRAEDEAQAAQRFAKYDTNGDGRIDAAERQAAGSAAGPAAAMIGRMLERFDDDEDGIITRAEYDAQTKDRFARMDVNDDGFIDAAERTAGRPRNAGRRGKPGAGSTPPPPAQPSPVGA